MDFDSGDGDFTEEQKLAFILSKWDDIEQSIVQTAKYEKLAENLGEYVKDAKKEINEIRAIRLFVSIGVGIVICLLVSALAYFLFCRPTFFTHNQTYSGVAFIVSSITAIVVLFVTLLRGAFRSIKDRNKDEELPPYLSQMADIVKTIGNQN